MFEPPAQRVEADGSGCRDGGSTVSDERHPPV
jgi:hypothetical protein